MCLFIVFFFFFFKQKTAYELRISDWSSDVCSSDLLLQQVDGNGVPVGEKVLAIRGTDGRQFKILISVEPQPAVSCHATAIVNGRPTTSQGAAHGNQPSAVDRKSVV